MEMVSKLNLHIRFLYLSFGSRYVIIVADRAWLRNRLAVYEL